jgi:peptidoglycan/xylan/chitin deacetylase (PgdA/CDA1 family)
MRPLAVLRGVFELALVGAVVALLLRHPEALLPARPEQPPGPICSVPTDEKIAALTYDDGPQPPFTTDILDLLDRYHIKATFFMIGEQMEKYPEIVKQVVARGHVIGNHTYTHPHDIEADTSAQVIRELEQCEQVIERMTGKRTHLFRPPRGLVDGTVLDVAREEGYQTILWTVCADHHDAPTPALMANRVLQHTKPGAIILAHDGTVCTRIKDVEATPLIIEELLRQGYRFVTVPDLLRARPRRLAHRLVDRA